MRKFMINQWMEWGNPLLDKPIWVMDQNSSPTQFHDYSMDSVVAFVTVRRAVLPSHIFAHQHSQISPLCFNVGICLGNALPQLHEKIQRYPKRGEKNKLIIVCCCRRGNSCFGKKKIYCCWASALVSCAKHDDHKSGKTSCATSNKK